MRRQDFLKLEVGNRVNFKNEEWDRGTVTDVCNVGGKRNVTVCWDVKPKGEDSVSVFYSSAWIDRLEVN